MKKLFSIILAIVLVSLCALPAFAAEEEKDASFGAYEHVFIIGVDGAGRFFRDADTPNFDRIFKDGAVDYTARAETVTVSAQNWGAILTGVSYMQHKLTNSSTEPRKSDTQYPTIFTYARKAMPNAELASYLNWNVINEGIIETDLGVKEDTTNDDGELTDMICKYFEDGGAPALFFVQYDSVDHVGHSKGSKSSEFIKQIETVDGYIGRVYDTIASKGLMDNGLFIIVADHGHTRAGGHGGLTMRETNVTLAVAGKTVVKGGTMDKNTRNRDVAAIALHALGIERPAHMTARVPGNLFNGTAGEKRNIRSDIPDAILSSLAWLVTLCTALF